MIEAASLIPLPRLRRQTRLRRRRLWIRAVVLTALAGAAASFAARSLAVDPGAATPEMIAEARQRLDDRTAQRDALRTNAAAVAATYHAVSYASDHPDWSILLAYVAQLCGDQIALTSLVLEPMKDAPGAFTVNITGIGRTQTGIAAFVLALENSGVFTSTRLDGSGGRFDAGGTPFSVTCLINPNGVKPDAPKGDAKPTKEKNG